MTITDAVRGLGIEGTTGVTASAECAEVPALLGTRPYGDCGAIAQELCRCDPHCDLDIALGRACLALPGFSA